MMPHLPLADGSSVLVDADVEAAYAHLKWKRLAGRVVSIPDNQVFDLISAIGGPGALQKEGQSDYRRANLAQMRVSFRSDHGIETFSSSPHLGVALRPAPTFHPACESAPALFRLPTCELGFQDYASSTLYRNVVVDSAAVQGTVLTLSHWPGSETPVRFKAESSAESVFKWLASGERVTADVVTSDHFDLDGLVSAFAVMCPEVALAHRDLLVQVARCGDFACTGDLDAIRAAACFLTIAAEGSGAVTGERRHAEAFRKVLPLVRSVLTKPEKFKSVWNAADAAIKETECAFSTGAITLEEDERADLAVFNLYEQRVARRSADGPLPTYMGWDQVPFHTRTECKNILLVHRYRYELWQRYEGWVEMPARPLRGRPNLAALAASLTLEEKTDVRWSSDDVTDIVPRMLIKNGGESTLQDEAIRCRIASYLMSAPTAWDPYA